MSRWSAFLGWLAGSKPKSHQTAKSRARTVSPDPFDEAQGAADDIFDRVKEWKLQVRNGTIATEEYLDLLQEEAAFADQSIENWRLERRAGVIDQEEMEEAIFQLREAKSFLRECADAPPSPPAPETDRPAGMADKGKWARFQYLDSEGATSKREIANWQVSGRYVRGYDRSRKDERTFRIDRISDWQSG